MISFGLLSDLQYCDAAPSNNRYFRHSVLKLKSCINTFNDMDLCFVADLGDIIDRDWESFDHILPYYDLFRHPVYHLTGNHDFEVVADKKSAVWKKVGTGEPPYYKFDLEGWRFIALDGNTISMYANPENSRAFVQAQAMLIDLEKKQALQAYHWNGAIDTPQLLWLDRQLTEADEKQLKVIIFCHFPIFPDDKHNLLNTDEVLDLLEKQKCVKAWFCGHHHRGNYGNANGIHCINVRGMVDTESEPAFCRVDLLDDRILIEGFGREVSRNLAI